ncbi:MAG TPA: YvcK family protein [Candidatus Avacidaminococcus intestinavium]|uniref:Putative gluconeogenesis factor n=1 Tax=Candidatus Avacidaminococcus intestinavium TaxID=2840684 RepID=A0A9D1MQ14_9FIRM|nr:YvcK family protein [Candidatus Avacidaminococcus intestinavium]
MGWIKWLWPGMNLKRWLFLFTVGAVFSAIGIALVFNYQFMGFIEELLFRMMYMATGEYYRAISVGGGLAVLFLGLVLMFYATRRIVHSVMESVLPDENTPLMEKIFRQRKLNKGPAITVVGGGTGLSVLLRGMKYITNNCTAVVSTADNGGSSGRLRQEMGIIPPGDLRNCLVALADTEPLMEKIMQFRFKGDNQLAGHSLGNLFIAALAEVEGSVEAGLAATSEILKVRGHVVPSTLEDVNLMAEMSDGTVVKGESEITLAGKRIKRMSIVPSDAHATQGAINAILQSDILILGPGSLYTSVIANVLVPEIKEALVASKAVKIYVCNVMTQPGETDGFGAYEHVEALVDHVGTQFLDYVIVNNQRVTATQLSMYQEKGSMPVSPDVDAIRQLGIQVVPASLISNDDFVRHDPVKLAQTVISLVYRLKMFGKGVQFFDYLFVRQSIKNLEKSKRGE